MNANIFQDIRQAAEDVASEFGASQNLEVDVRSAQLVKFPGQWRGLWIFNAVNVAGDFKELAVMMEPSGPDGAREVRLMSPGILRRVCLAPFRARVADALAKQPKSQGQFVSDVCYANWKREQGEREAFAAVMGGTGAPVAQLENWPAGRPFPHQAE